MKKNIAVITSSRADYGLIKNLLFLISAHDDFDLKLFVTGMHLSKRYGLTYQEILKDKIDIYKKIDINLISDDPLTLSSSISIGIKEFSKAFKRLKPDLLIVLGDRFELLSAVIPASFENMPIAHIHGGEATEGVLDEAVRHSITKFSHIHFVSSEIYRKRVIQLGENPSNVFNVGGLGIDAIATTNLLTKKEIQKKLKIKFSEKSLIVTYHPVTLQRKSTQKDLSELILSLENLKDITLIITLPNSDLDNLKIISSLKSFSKKNPNVYLFKSLGQLNYFSLLSIVDGVIGNSSSGLLEVPYFKKGTINIGDRQKGRLKANSIIDCKPNSKSIIKAIKTLYSIEFQKELKNVKSPYGNKGASQKIMEIIKQINLTNLIQKKFYDINN